MQKKPYLKRIALLFVASFFILTGQACGGSGVVEGPPRPVTLEWWTVFKDARNVRPLIEAYQARFPHISVNVRLVRFDEFETTLLNALAEDRGPDIFTIHNTEIGKYESKIVPMPATTSINIAVEQGTISKQIVTETRTYNSFSERYMNNTFLDHVLQDVRRNDNEVYGLPLSSDTLAMYYNKALLSAANIPLPAKNYAELQEHVIRLSQQNSVGNIVQSGIALGTHDNIERFVDIVSLLMMQNGTQMTDDFGNPTFDIIPPGLERQTIPASDALIFYTDFAQPDKQVYNWNASQPNNLEAFMNGSLGYFLGYAYHRPIIETQAPQLNFDVAPMPQITGNTPVNFANYWVEVVSNKSENVDEAWNFLQYITQPENVEQYLDAANLPTATKTLVGSQQEDVEIGVFADQLLTARSWYRGVNPSAVEDIFATMIDRVKAGDRMRTILGDARNQVSQTMFEN